MRSKEYDRQYQLARYHRRRQEAIDSLGGKCVACGSTESLEIDHINPAAKTYSIGRMWGMAKEKFWVEVAKCQLLCHPCHVEKSRHEQEVWEHGSWAMVDRKCPCAACRSTVNTYMQQYRKEHGR